MNVSYVSQASVGSTEEMVWTRCCLVDDGFDERNGYLFQLIDFHWSGQAK